VVRAERRRAMKRRPPKGVAYFTGWQWSRMARNRRRGWRVRGNMEHIVRNAPWFHDRSRSPSL
jgi:hypothetical protein